MSDRATAITHARRVCRRVGFPEHELTDEQLIDVAASQRAFRFTGPATKIPGDVLELLSQWKRPPLRSVHPNVYPANTTDKGHQPRS